MIDLLWLSGALLRRPLSAAMQSFPPVLDVSFLANLSPPSLEREQRPFSPCPRENWLKVSFSEVFSKLLMIFFFLVRVKLLLIDGTEFYEESGTDPLFFFSQYVADPHPRTRSEALTEKPCPSPLRL